MTTNHQAGLPRTVAVINGKGGTFKTGLMNGSVTSEIA